MAEQKEQKKVELPARCTERVVKAGLKSDVSLVGILGQSKTLVLGLNDIYKDSDIEAMAVHPHGLFVSANVKTGAGSPRRKAQLIIPAVNLMYYELEP